MQPLQDLDAVGREELELNSQSAFVEVRLPLRLGLAGQQVFLDLR